MKGAIDGISVYSETHTVTTNKFGLVILSIGSGTSSANMAAIKWGEDKYFLQIKLDATGGSKYEHMGTSQMLSVPYELYGGAADTV